MTERQAPGITTRVRRIFPAAAIVALAACSSDETSRSNGNDDAAGEGGGTAGSAPDARPDLPSEATPDAPSTPDTSPDVPADSPPEDAGADVTDAPLPDSAPDVAMLVCTGDGGFDSGDAAGGGGEWRDWSANACRSCPGDPIRCHHLLAPPGPSYDDTSQILDLHLDPGHAEMVSASLQYQYCADVDGGLQCGLLATPAIAQVDRDRLSVDFTGLIPASTTELYAGVFTVTDACGSVSDTSDSYTNDAGFTSSFELRVNLVPLEGGLYEVRCNDTD